MFNFKLIGLPIIIAILSFSEVLVFNEEVLLALCFLAFIFYAYSFVGQSIQSAFDDISQKIETNFLQSTVDQVVALFVAFLTYTALLQSRLNWFDQLKVWSISVLKTYGLWTQMWPNTLVNSFNELLNKALSTQFAFYNELRLANSMQVLFSILPTLLIADTFKLYAAKKSVSGIKFDNLVKSTVAVSLLLK